MVYFILLIFKSSIITIFKNRYYIHYYIDDLQHYIIM